MKLGVDLPRLDSFTRDEWFSVARIARPGLTREQYERMWDDFQVWKARKALH